MRTARAPCTLLVAITTISTLQAGDTIEEERLFLDVLDVTPRPIAEDPTVRWDYDIAYVRARRAGDEVHKRFYTDIAAPVYLEPGADLMLLHPDGNEDLLVEGGKGAVTDPMVSLDGEWIFYTLIHTLEGAGQWQPPSRGADIYKIHARTREIVRLTSQEFTPNTGAADWSHDCRAAQDGKNHLSYGVLNFGPCPLPGGRIVFTSNRNAFRPPRGYPTIALQLFVMDGDGSNVEQIGHLNIAGALHPVVLVDGRIMFSSLESQGARSDILWGIWSIHPDGTRWGPIVSAFDPGGAPNAFHFQTQLSDGSLVIEEYYNQNNSGFGAYIRMPPPRYPPGPDDEPAFGPARMGHPRNRPLRFGRFENGRGKYYRMPFMPARAESLTPFALNGEGPADAADPKDPRSPKVGKFTHPSGAPDNHLLTVWSPGPVNHQYKFLPQLDGGIYLLKDGKPIAEPGDLLLVKNDPKYNECWPRAVVPYRRIYGVDEPATLPPLRNDGRASRHLIAGSPFGLVGSSSLYKRESYPDGAAPPGKTTASYAGRNDPWRGLDAFTSHGNGMPLNWHNQGADVGLYGNDEIHAVRILVMEPTTDRNRGPRSGRRFHSHARERLRIIGEIPVRKIEPGGGEPLDPDGNPDTSFLAKIPADTAFTFQTIDRRGLLLNMAQTWHQLRPGEVRTDCGGCHAHSQKPTSFEKTRAGAAGYEPWDLGRKAPLIAARSLDASGKTWDREGETGIRHHDGVLDVEYLRDVKPILERSCAACHSSRHGKPAGNLDLDADGEEVEVEGGDKLPGTYYRLAADERGRFGHRPAGWDSWGFPQTSRYIRKLQARRSLLVWKIFGRRLDGFSNDDHPSETEPGSGVLASRGKPIDLEKHRHEADIDFTGSIMPPPDAVAGTYTDGAGRKVKVAPLSDEDRRTILRWIDLGCPIDLDARKDRTADARPYGWFCDDNRPVIALASPAAGENGPVSRIVLGLHDYYTGLAEGTFRVTADFPLAGARPGEDIAARFRDVGDGVRELVLPEPIGDLKRGTLLVSVQDRQGNIARVKRTFSVSQRIASGSPEPGAGLSSSPGAFPRRVHVIEDFETEIEKRWWLRGEGVTSGLAPSLSATGVPNRRAMRAAPTKDFDDLMGDPAKDYLAVVFNPVPGPPMGPRTMLSFRYRLEGTDEIRVQIYSLTNGYHRRLQLQGLPQGRWERAFVDLSSARRPDGSGGPLSENERIDDIQLYVKPGSQLLADDIVLYEPGADAPREAWPFPGRFIFTAWFDTGKQGAEWPGDFEIVAHEPPRTWKAARSVIDPRTGEPWIRIGMRGRRPVGAEAYLRVWLRVSRASDLRMGLVDSGSGKEWIGTAKTHGGRWERLTMGLAGLDQDSQADEILIRAPAGVEVLVDDILLWEPPGQRQRI